MILALDFTRFTSIHFERSRVYEGESPIHERKTTIISTSLLWHRLPTFYYWSGRLLNLWKTPYIWSSLLLYTPTFQAHRLNQDSFCLPSSFFKPPDSLWAVWHKPCLPDSSNPFGHKNEAYLLWFSMAILPAFSRVHTGSNRHCGMVDIRPANKRFLYNFHHYC